MLECARMHTVRLAVILPIGVAFLLIIPKGIASAGTLREEAVGYRVQGFEAQRRGDMPSALAFYQKAAALDPTYPTPRNDIGVLLEDQGRLQDAEQSYQKALELNPPAGDCCVGAPPVLEFDQAGNLLRHWGGPGSGYEWPASNHGITIDYKGNVWLGGNGGPDSQVLKFKGDGTFVYQIGKAGAKGPNSNDTNGGINGTPEPYWPADTTVNPKTNLMYIADGYGNRRVLIVDATDHHWAREITRASDMILARLHTLLGTATVNRIVVNER